MGFIKAFAGTVSGTLANQWKEFYTCDSLPVNVLVRRATHMVSGRSSNKKKDEDDITKDSLIVVNDGQCVILVCQGKILDVAAEPGAYKWQDNTSPSFFAGSFSDVVRHGWQRFTFGGQNPVQQRLYYVNTKDLPGFRFGTPSPIGFRVVDRTTGLDLETTIRCNGTYLLHVVDPVRLYTAFAGNIANEYTVDNLDDQLRAEFVQALQPAFGELSAKGLRPSELAGETKAISEALKNQLDFIWQERYGLSLIAVQILSAVIPDEDRKKIQMLQEQAVYRNGQMAGAALIQAQAEAMKTAAGNPNGAMMGFAGMNFAMQAGGVNAGQFYQNQNPPAGYAAGTYTGNPAAGAAYAGQSSANQQVQPLQQEAETTDSSWFCPNCGRKNNGNFCPKCGTKKPDNV